MQINYAQIEPRSTIQNAFGTGDYINAIYPLMHEGQMLTRCALYLGVYPEAVTLPTSSYFNSVNAETDTAVLEAYVIDVPQNIRIYYRWLAVYQNADATAFTVSLPSAVGHFWHSSGAPDATEQILVAPDPNSETLRTGINFGLFDEAQTNFLNEQYQGNLRVLNGVPR